jgi:hypothetical protein
MASISITNLQPAGSGLLADSESFIDSMRDLSENELKLTRGGKKDKSKAKNHEQGSCGCGNGCLNVPDPVPTPIPTPIPDPCCHCC